MSSDARSVSTSRWKQHTICRACHVQCSLIVEMDHERPVKLYGDKDNPVSHGFSCIKGRQLVAYHNLPSRLIHSMKRGPDGNFVPCGTQLAISEIATKLNHIVSKYGERAVAGYGGTFSYLNSMSFAFLHFFMEAIGSRMLFTAATIDQPGKLIAAALHGMWLGGQYRDSQELDVALVVGQNPIVSLGGSFGFSPAHNIIEAKRRGMKLIVCDPRETETARKADVFLQCRPGEDASILAGIIRFVLSCELYDREFVSAESNGLSELRAAVEPFTPEHVAVRAGVGAEDLVSAARTYASGRRGLVICGTGPNMSGRGTLTEYLGRTLMTLAGHWPRAGERVLNPGVLIHPRHRAIAATAGPTPGWGFGEKLRVHNLTESAAGMPTAALADEILTPGEGQVRALIVLGGNPLLAFPDQSKVQEAMKSLDLLVCIDPHLSATARLGHYVIAPTLPLETPSTTSFNELLGTWDMIWGYDTPYAQYTPALMQPPAGSDVIDEWKFFYRLAREMGIQLCLKPISHSDPKRATELSRQLDMLRTPTTEEMMDLLFEGSPVPLARVRENGRAGHVFEVAAQRIEPKPDGWSGRFDLGNPIMLSELATVSQERSYAVAGNFAFRMTSRRLRDAYNSSWHEHEPLKRQWRHNPAFMNPEDMTALGLRAGDQVEICSDRATIPAIVESAPDVRQGCVSMSHGWGVNLDEVEDPAELGGCTSRLSSTDRDCDPYSWMARQSCIPVNVRKSLESSDPHRRE